MEHTKTYTVKEIAEKAGMTVHAVRFYTDKGLLPCPRDEKGRRIFTDESLNWLRGIQCLRGCGVSVEDIKVYSDLCMAGDEALQARYAFMVRQRELAYQRLREAQALVEYMEHKVEHYESILRGELPDDTTMAADKVGHTGKN